MRAWRTLKVAARPPVLDVTLSRPERRNALTAEMIGELHAALDAAEADPAIRLLVLSGEGDTFSSGMDFVDAGSETSNAAALEETVDAYWRLMERFTASRVVVVSLATGRVTAGGVGLVAASDYAIAGPRATFQLSEVVFGLLPATVAPFVIRRCGWQAAFRLSLTAERIDAARAAANSLVDELSEAPADVLRRFLVKAARVDPECVAALKGMFREMWIVNEGTRQVATEAIRRQILRPETQAAIRRFVEGGGAP